MLGFVRKREVEERIRKAREECLNYTHKVDDYHNDRINLILEHLGLRVIPARQVATTTPAHLAPRQSPAKKAKKRTTTKANDSTDEGGG